MRICVVGWHGMPHVRRWARFFAARGHVVTVVTCGGGDAVDLDESGAAPAPPYAIVDLGPPRGGKLGYLAKIPRARHAVRAARPDVVHAHTATSYGLLALAAGARPLAVTTHGSDVLLSPRHSVLRSVIRRVLHAAALVTVPGEHMLGIVERLRGDAHGDIVVLQYGVEADRLAEAGRTLRAGRPPGGPVRIVTSRPLTALYNTDTVVRAAARLERDWRLDVAGDGPEREALERLAADLGVGDRVVFHGLVDERVVEALVGGADVYVSMASSDGVSISLLEALALGTVPVLSDIPANRAWVDDGVDGTLTGPEPGDLADAIARALTLDAAQARRSAFARVRERADRETNLAAFEERLAALAGVSR